MRRERFYSAPTKIDLGSRIFFSAEIPFIETRFDFDTKQPVLNLHPHPGMLCRLVLSSFF